MGRQARARRQRAAAGTPPAAAPPAGAPPRWYRNPWKAGLAGAGLFTGLAVVRLAFSSLVESPPHGPSSSSSSIDAAPATLEIAEAEPNDEALSPQRLPGLPIVLGATLGGGDRDRFHVSVDGTGGHLLRASIDGPPGLHLDITRDGASRASATTPAAVRALGVSEGEYVVVVQRDAGAPDGGAPVAYRLHISTTPWSYGLEWEPNDTPDEATRLDRLPPGLPPKIEPPLMEARASGWWSRPDDVDCFELPLAVPPAGAVVRLVLTPPAAVTARLRVLDTGDREARLPRQTLVDVTGPAAGAPIVVPALGARSWEPSYIVCAQAADGAIVDATYTLEARIFTPAGPFEFEPNEREATATALPRGATIAGYLTRGDVDLYQLSTGPEPSIEVSVDVPEGVAAELIVSDEGGAILARRTGEPGERLALTAAGIARVALRAREGGSDTTRYRLTAAKPMENATR